MPHPLLRRAVDLSDWDLQPVAEVWVDTSAEPKTVIGAGELSADVVPSLLTTVLGLARKGYESLTVDLRAMTATDSRVIRDLRRALAELDEPTRIMVLAGDAF
jgi:hypothetical protein